MDPAMHRVTVRDKDGDILFQVNFSEDDDKQVENMLSLLKAFNSMVISDKKVDPKNHHDFVSFEHDMLDPRLERWVPGERS